MVLKMLLFSSARFILKFTPECAGAGPGVWCRLFSLHNKQKVGKLELSIFRDIHISYLVRWDKSFNVYVSAWHHPALIQYHFWLMLRFRSVSITKPKYYCLKIIYLLYSSMSSYFGPSWKACKGSKWSLSARHLQRLLQLRIFHLMLNLLFYSFYEFTFGDLEIVPKINVLTRLVLHC